MKPIVLRSEVRELSGDKSLGGKEIPIVLLKNSGEEGVAAITVLCNRGWQTAVAIECLL